PLAERSRSALPTGYLGAHLRLWARCILLPCSTRASPEDLRILSIVPRPDIKRLVEWLSCTIVHYSGLDRFICPLHRSPGKVGCSLLYHRVHPEANARPKSRLTQSVFRAQLQHPTRRYRVMHLEELVDLLATGRPLPTRAVAVTFDDGYRDTYSLAFPVI